jgi:hypothetical protein
LRQVPQSDYTQMAQKMETYVLDQLIKDIRHVAQQKFGGDKAKKVRWLKYILDNNPRNFKKLEMTALREVWRELNGEEAKV